MLLTFPFACVCVSVSVRAQPLKQLEATPGFDLRAMLGGADAAFRNLIHASNRAPSVMFSSLPVVEMPSATRARISSIVRGLAVPDVAYAILLAGGELVTWVQPADKTHTLQPFDVLLLTNVIQSSHTLRSVDTWMPVCLPRYNSSGMLHAYIACLATMKAYDSGAEAVKSPASSTRSAASGDAGDQVGSPASADGAAAPMAPVPAVPGARPGAASTALPPAPAPIVAPPLPPPPTRTPAKQAPAPALAHASVPESPSLQSPTFKERPTANRKGMFLVLVSSCTTPSHIDAMTKGKARVHRELRAERLLRRVAQSCSTHRYTVEEFGISHLRHFACVWRRLSQYTMPAWPADLATHASRKQLLHKYYGLYCDLTSVFPALQQAVHHTPYGAMAGTVAPNMTLLALFDPCVDPGEASKSVARLAKAIRRDVARFSVHTYSSWPPL